MKILKGIFFLVLYSNPKQHAHFNQFLDQEWIWAFSSVIGLVPVISPVDSRKVNANVVFPPFIERVI